MGGNYLLESPRHTIREAVGARTEPRSSARHCVAMCMDGYFRAFPFLIFDLRPKSRSPRRGILKHTGF